jgi:hypothetical protein
MAASTSMAQVGLIRDGRDSFAAVRSQAAMAQMSQ